MKVLGLSFNYHDASAALLDSGTVIASAAEERFSRQKHDPTFPIHSIRYCLKTAGIDAHELDFIAFHEDTATKLTRTLASSLARWPVSLSSFVKTAKDFVTGGSWIHNSISKELNVAPEKILFIPHHMSHASHALYGSGFDEAAVMTIDAVGEWTSSAIFSGSGGKLSPRAVSAFPNSLGLTYSAFTSFLGFKVNDGECSTMALAAFGQPTYADAVRRIIHVRPDGGHDIDISYFNFRSDTELPVTEKFIAEFGMPRSPKNNLGFDCMSAAQAKATADDRRFADIACSLQLVVEEAVLAFAKRARKLTGSPRLCYAGGVALNCVANSKLVASGIFDEVFVPPDPGDGGGAMGAALYVSGLKTKMPKKRLSPYLGEAYSAKSVEVMKPHLNPSRWHHFTRLKNQPLKQQDLRWADFGSDDSLCEETARLITSGSSVGWLQGRFENGPRALGNRSILLRPDNVELARRLSEKVKLRAAFRPYALSMTEEEARKCLQLRNGAITHTTRWMQESVQVKEDRRSRLAAALHVDGTTRVQIVSRDENPLFHLLLQKIGKTTGQEALLNTSFNESGFPIVGGPVDALATFARTELDALAIGNLILERSRP